MGCSPYTKDFKQWLFADLAKRMLTSMLFFVLPITLFSGTTGKIAGTILDAETREALIGANVIVNAAIIDGKDVALAAPMGASTDAEGQYFILNLRPGTYVIEASFIGYQKQVLRGVVVEVDRTTKLDFNLSPQSLTSEEIVVTAERSPLVVMDQTSASAKISGEDIKALPVENFTDVIKLTAGVTTGLGGDIHIRGGRSSEIQYYVDGIAVSNPFNNALAVPVENNAIQELEVISGTFNAEYGQAMSGIVNMVTREGSEEFDASLSAYTGDFVSNRTGVFYNIDDFDALSQKYIEGNLSGPLPFLKNVTFFASGKYQKQNNWLYGQRVFMPGDSTNMTSPTPDDYYIESSGDSAAVPMAPYQNFSGMFKLTWQLSPLIKVSYKFMGNSGEGKFYGNYYKLNPDYLPTNYSWSQSHFLKWDQQINASTFYNVNIAYYERDSKNYKYENPADPRYRNVYKRGTFQPAFVLSTGGVDPNHSYQNSTTITGRADLMMQVNKYNLVKVGIEGRKHRLQYEYYKVFVNPVEYNDYVPRIPPLSAIDHNRYDEEPFEFAAYIQDKIEIEDLIVNLGLRFDYFDPNSVIPTNFSNPNNNPEYGALPENEAYNDVKAKTQLSPRLGLAFPISSQGVIHAAYGQFFQIPEFSRLYENREFEVIGSYSSFIGNADLDAQRTVMYEIGLQQQLNSYVAVDVTAFYRDIRNLLGTRLYSAANNTINYGRYINTDYGNVRGLTISTKLRLPESGITGGLDYTYQVATGIASDPKQAFYDAGGRNETTVIFVPLSWDLRHTANAYINYNIDSWGISVISRFNSGYPFTPLDPTTQRESSILELRNDGRYQSEFFMDLRAFKRFELGGYQAEIFLKVDNLLDTYRKDLLPELDPRDEQAQKDLQWDKVNSRYQYVLNPALQPVPREVKLGVKFDF
ncbi:MAG: TonB-dependent receptor [Calditrichae bacterium]|nr:TonB-dependent receptor [Calditrichia bacterium]